MTELYNLHTEGDGYRITKFVDGEVESSYLMTDGECECPAGHRYTCRHRQMLPSLLPIANTHWFWDRAREKAVDINGLARSQIQEVIYVNHTVRTEADLHTGPKVVPAKSWRRI